MIKIINKFKYNSLINFYITYREIYKKIYNTEYCYYITTSVIFCRFNFLYNNNCHKRH